MIQNNDDVCLECQKMAGDLLCSPCSDMLRTQFNKVFPEKLKELEGKNLFNVKPRIVSTNPMRLKRINK